MHFVITASEMSSKLAQYDHHSHKNDVDQSHLGCTGPLSTEPGTGVADEGGELLVEGEAGQQAQHLIIIFLSMVSMITIIIAVAIMRTIKIYQI